MLSIKKRFPSRELYLATGVVASIAVAGAVAAVVSAHALRDQSAIMPTKVVKANDDSKKEPEAQKAAQTPVKEYSGATGSRVANNVPSASTAPLATSAPTVSPEPTSTPLPSPDPEPTPIPEEPTPEPTPEG